MQKPKRILALLLVAVLTVTQLPVMALATSAGEGGEIIAFDPLPEETADQAVPLGTSLEDLDLPGTLDAIVRVVKVSDTKVLEPEGDKEPAQDSGEPLQPAEPSEPVADAGSGGEGEPEPQESTDPVSDTGSEDEAQQKQAPAEPEMMEMNIPVPVEWISTPDYDGEKAGTYTFTAQIEGFTVSAALPSITVTVGEVTGIVTAFEELPDNIRWQNTAGPTFPETVGGTVEGEAVQIPVAWQTEQDYDGNAPECGLYVFDAVPGEGYTLAGGVEAPRITVYIPDQRMMMRMGGDGTSGSALQITTAAQLAEIAVLVNAGRLESFLLNGIGNVSLKLMNDLDLSAYGQDYNGGKGWQPIGGYINNRVMPFKGSFDGNGYTISGLYINDSSRDYVGLFGMIESATIQNLNLRAVSVSAKSNVGSIIGNASGSGEITTCRVSGSVSGVSNVGGIIGSTYSMTPKYSMSRCSFEGSVSGDVSVSGNLIGGLAGTAKDLTIVHSYASAPVSGNENVGGLVGKLEGGNGKLQNCYAIGNVIGKSSVGGLAGLPYSSSIENCVALNSGVEATGTYGGRVTGQNYNGTLSGNAAFSGMVVTVNGSTKTITSDAASVDGADVAAADLKADGNIGGRFTAANGWTVENGKLPGFDTAVDMPEYITGGSDPNFPGEGTEESPFLIGTAERLAKLAELVNAGNTSYNAKYYQLIADIDLSNYGASNTDFNSGKGWVPIGNNINKFMGSFDGNGKTITRLYIDDIGRDYVGLFGYIKENAAAIHNLTVKDASIDAGGSTGGIVGRAEGGARINHCSVNGTVTGSGNIGGVVGFLHEASMDQCGADVAVSGSTIGGVVGKVEKSSSVTNCYAIGSITDKGGNYDLYSYMGVGGVAGSVNGGSTVENCYSTGGINSTSTGSVYVAGVVGYVSGSTVKNCAALNTSISGSYNAFLVRVGGCSNKLSSTFSDNIAFNGVSCTITSSDIDYNGTAKTADELQTANGFPSALTAAPWTYEPGKLPGLFGKTVEMPAHITAKLTSYFAGGDGSQGDPYQIATAAQLAKLAELVNDPGTNEQYGGENVHYKLTDNLDLSGYGASNTGFNSGKGWVPIGDCPPGSGTTFNGHFDGNHKTITGLYINDSTKTRLGLFGYIYEGSVKNLGLTNVNITGNQSVGGIAAIMSGKIENCYVSGKVTGTWFVGGIAGSVYGILQNCYVTGSVGGTQYVGGIAGGVDGGLQNCYSTASVITSAYYAGGIAGIVYNTGTVKNCAALNPKVSAGAVVGRVAGSVDSGGTLAGNCAFSGMIGGGNAKTADGTDGADMTAGEINTAEFWYTDTNWDSTATWANPAWNFQDGYLPLLKKFIGQSGDGGLYLTERDIANATVTVGGPYTYTGSAIEPSLIVTFDGVALVKDKDYTVAITSTDDTGSGTSAGANAGAVTITLTGKGNYKGTKTDVDYEIQPKVLSADMLTIPNGPFIYTPGVPQMPTPTVMDDGKLLVAYTDYTVVYANGVFAGAAEVIVTGKGNYTGVVTKSFTVEKATPAALTWPNASKITYGAALSASSLIGGSATGTWTWADGTIIPTVINSGYEVTFTPADTANYDWSGVTLWQNVPITVDKASGLTVSTQPSMNAKEGVTRSYEFSMDNIALNKADAGAKTYSAAEGTDVNSILSNVQVSGSKLTYTISNTAAVGNTAAVAITISTANYEDVVAALTVTVTAKETQAVSFVESTVTKTYGDANFTQTAALQGDGGTGQITYVSDNTAIATVNATTGEVAIVSTGSANITATKAADDDWYAATATYALEVSKKTVTIAAHDKTAKAGQSQPVYTYAVTGLLPGDSLSTEPTINCSADMNTAGTYDIVPSGADAGANYAIAYQNGTLTVSSLSTACDVTGVTSPAGSKISGTSITGTVANSVSSQLVGITVSTDAAWALYSDMACTTEITNKTMTLSVGANTAYIKVTAEDGITTKIYTVTITRSASTGGGGSGGGSGGGGSSGSTGSGQDIQAGSSINQAIRNGQTETTITAAGGGKVILNASDLTQQKESNLTVSIQYPDLQVGLNPGALPQPSAGGSLQLSASPVNDPKELNALYLMAPDGRRIGVGYSLSINEVNGTQTQAVTRLNGEITLTFELSAEDLEGIDPASLTVYKVDDSGNLSELGGQYQNGSITVSTSHLCRFFITGKVAKERLQGSDRYLTAAAISHKGWEQGNDVILASGENYTDALTGAVLAGMLDAPVLLTGKDGLNEAVLKEIKRLHAKNIYIIGGTGVVSASAETQLKEAYHVQRLQGVDRYGTAAAVGEKIKEQNSTAQNILDTVILTTAQNYPDALAIAPFAAQAGTPILFTAGENLNPVTKQALKDWGIQKVIIAGGTGAIGASVEDELRNSLQIKTERLSGTDRYGTALAIAKYFSPQGDYEGVVVATGESFADALAGASFAAQNSYPVLLTGRTRMDKGVLDYIGDLKLHKVYILGGEGAVSDQVKEAIY